MKAVLKKRIILANTTINRGNKGCSALSYSALYFIDKVLKERGVEYDIYLTDSGHYVKGNYSVDVGGNNISYKAISYPLRKGYKVIKDWVLFPWTLKNLNFFKKADYILDIGQGDSFSDIYGKDRFEDIDRIHRLARLINKPYCLLPQTIGPFSNQNIRKKAVISIAKANVVMARDKMSYDYVKNNVRGQNQIAEYIDIAFYLPFVKTEFDRRYTHVGLNINALLWNGGYSGNNELGLKDDYQNVVRNIIDFFLRLDKVKLHLIPHVVNQERVLENDYSVSVDLVNEYRNENLVVAPFFFSPIEAKNYISGMDFFMGARMHSTIAAFSSGVPVVPMAYSRKFNGLFGDTLSYKYFVDLKASDSKTILEFIQECYKNRDNLMKAIQSQQRLIEERGKLIQDSLISFFNL